MATRQPTVEELRQILTIGKTIAVVGLSDSPDRPSYGVARYLKNQGYRIIPVNPKITKTLGEKAYPSLRDIPEPVDIVDIFRRSQFASTIVKDALAIGAKAVWMQQGVVNEAAAARARAAGIKVVMDRCIATTHEALRTRGLL